MNNRTRTALGLAAAAGILASCTSQEKPPPAESTSQPAPLQITAPPVTPPLTVEESAQLTMTARVKAIDQATRKVTLQDAAGHTETVIAGPEIKRLNEVSVGDMVTARCTATLIAELRPPTPEETASPITAVAVAGRSPTGADPAAGAATGVKVVTTVQAVDLPAMLVTLKGPMGDTAIVRARNPENIKKLHVGDTIVITYIEAMAMSLEKALK